MANLRIKKSVWRGCGARVPGHVYTSTDQDKVVDSGIPIEFFGICPPWRIDDPQNIGLSDQGVAIIEGTPYGRPGIYDIWAVVGYGNYFVPDYWHEGELFGFSWKIPRTAQFDLLTMDSRQIMVSKRAFVDNVDQYPAKDRIKVKSCPLGNENHDKHLEEMCLGLLWELVGGPHKDGLRYHQRQFPPDIPMFGYEAAYIPKDFYPQWAYGAFMWLPIHMFEVINDPLESTHEQAIRLLEESGTNIPYELVSE
jgi:hypothetical protein